MAQLVSARPFIIMPQENVTLQSNSRIKQERAIKPVSGGPQTGDWGGSGGGGWRDTHVQVLQTVPAEGVFAALAQHLSTALVPLDVDAAHGTLLDGQVRVAVRAGSAEHS